MRSFTVRAALALLVVVSAQAALAGVPGIMVLKNADRLDEIKVNMVFPPNWDAPLVLSVSGGDVYSVAFASAKQDPSRSLIAVAFTHLPKAKAETMVVLVGMYVPGERFTGDVLVKITDTNDPKLIHEMLVAVLKDPASNDYTHKGTFLFSKEAGAPAPRPHVVVGPNPPLHPPGVPVGYVAGHRGYQLNPYTNMLRPPATFMRNVPDAWSWQSQMQAQMVGNAKYDTLQRHIDRYAAPNYGFGFGFGGFGGGFR